MNDERATVERAGLTIERRYRARIQDVWQLWTTREGFESWWGPRGFRAEVRTTDARVGGSLEYEMIADSAEMIAAMTQAGQPLSHGVSARFTELRENERLVLTSVIDFLPGVAPYSSDIAVDLRVEGDAVLMVVTLSGMHDAQFTKMQKDGFTSQLTKLDARFG